METNYKAIQELADRIEKENVLFEAMTKDEKKVVIAEDCLIRIHARQLVAYCGMFINNPSDLKYIDQSIQSQLNTPEVEVQCEVCAKGGLFMSLIGRVNKFNPDEIDSGNSINDAQHKKLLEIFDIKELAYIEFAFEGEQYINYEFFDTAMVGQNPIEFTQEEILKAREFYAKWGGQFYGRIEDDTFSTESNDQRDFADENEERLIAICENIIENKGQFIL